MRYRREAYDNFVKHVRIYEAKHRHLPDTSLGTW